jgi:REP element-mobilizing transposase RayT
VRRASPHCVGGRAADAEYTKPQMLNTQSRRCNKRIEDFPRYLAVKPQSLNNEYAFGGMYMFRITKDTPCFYLTSVAHNRLPVFKTDKIKTITCAAIDEARNSCGFALLAYVIMPDHLHVITTSAKKSSVTLRFINGIVSRRVIDYLKENNHENSLAKIRHEEQEKGYKYSLWDHHPNVMLLWSEEMLM